MNPLVKTIKAFVSVNGFALAAVAGCCVSLATCDLTGGKVRQGWHEAASEIDSQSKGLTNEALKARAPAARPGAADRLLARKTCRDC